MSYRLGIDVGGTFTDFLCLGGEHPLVHKTSSTPADPSLGFVRGLEEIAARLEVPFEDFMARIELIVHGTTVSTNAVLTGNGARTGALLTAGFRDTLRLRDGTRATPYDNHLVPPPPLAPRELTHGVGERIGPEGQVLRELDEASVRAAAEALAAEGVEAVAISFMHSPQNADHERRARELVEEILPDAYLTASHELLEQIRYYPRTSTTVLNAYVGPIISGYMEGLTARLAELRFTGVLLIMQSNGGVATPAEISRRAALSLLSGPASGPTAGLHHLADAAVDACLTVDMGGTSFDVAMVVDGRPVTMTDGVVADWPLALPTIDIHTIGAGGGSIAAVDEGGLLSVGPRSAGAEPGPACYGRGGTEPTTTDADLILGYLSADSPLAGGVPLDLEAARRAFAPVAAALGVSIEEAAAGAYDLVNVNMATGVRDITVRRGLDPRDFPVVVAGGAGPLHAAAIAAELEVALLLVPRESSIFCAAGMLMCDFQHDAVRALKAPLAELDAAAVAATLAELAAAGRETLHGEGVADEAISFSASLDLRYAGQWHELEVPLPWEGGGAPDLASMVGRFDAEHDRTFGYSSPGDTIECLALRLSARGATAKPDLGEMDEMSSGAPDPVTRRPTWSARSRAMVDTPVYDGHGLGAGFEVSGPAIVELATTTIVVPDGFDLLVDRRGSFVLAAGERGRKLARDLLGRLHSVG
ncbi:MAG TPA: hydantoinase/oxoprolinase family protein [Solirubrobacterales bacterium]|nr:hydantoinase/oxoprolinase family protein [Solirubrobacterales bacterium]